MGPESEQMADIQPQIDNMNMNSTISGYIAKNCNIPIIGMITLFQISSCLNTAATSLIIRSET